MTEQEVKRLRALLAKAGTRRGLTEEEQAEIARLCAAENTQDEAPATGEAGFVSFSNPANLHAPATPTPGAPKRHAYDVQQEATPAPKQNVEFVPFTGGESAAPATFVPFDGSHLQGGVPGGTAAAQTPAATPTQHTHAAPGAAAGQAPAYAAQAPEEAGIIAFSAQNLRPAQAKAPAAGAMAQASATNTPAAGTARTQNAAPATPPVQQTPQQGQDATRAAAQKATYARQIQARAAHGEVPRFSDEPDDTDTPELFGDEPNDTIYEKPKKPRRTLRQLLAARKALRENAPPTDIPAGDGADVPPAKPKKEKKPRKPWRKRTIIAVLLLCILAGSTITIIADTAWQMRNDSLWLTLENLPYTNTTVLYAQREGSDAWEEYTTLYAAQQRQWVAIEDTPQNLQHAFVAIEDQHFYTHSGVSWKRTAFAILSEGIHAVTRHYIGGTQQGASTITQQLIKNLTADDDNSGISGYLRKVREIARALQLEKTYDKDTILEAYLNAIRFTDNTLGVQAESIKLFNKTVDELSLAQCASLAAIVKNPTRYDPVDNPETHLTRRNYILYEMWQQGYIAEDEYNTAAAQDIGLSAGPTTRVQNEITDYFTDKLLDDVTSGLVAEYGITRKQATSLLYNGGLRIYTTVDPGLQATMESAMTSGSLFTQSGKGVATEQTVYNDDGTVARDENGNAITETVTEYPQAAMVSVDYTGALKAVVGGLGTKTVSRGFNRATDALRQVGSTMKGIGPYALAMQRDRITWSSMYMDDAVKQLRNTETGEKEPWPANFSQTYSQKNMLVVDAFANSINTIAVRVGNRVGMGAIYRFCKNELGITSFVAKDKAAGPMVLGSSTYGVSPYEMAGAYMMFGSGGTVTTLHSYYTVQTGANTVLINNEESLKTKQAVSADTAYIMNRLLRTVVSYGTAAGSSVSGSMDSVGKTGTSSDNRDYWFVGLTPYYCTAVWYGYDSGYPLNDVHGTSEAAGAWQRVMSTAQRNLPARSFPTSDTVVTREYCTETGLLATDKCPNTRTGYYKSTVLPGVCSVHS